ncbi:unnamed protein product [Onchocerca flexuosa]|uniref:Thrombospondin type 1 domain protein n=1 Tax=Onchocerca flexuosa TaxID=387005 RepID=A0A183H0Y4_9BILA|nr:unnamed protein product [Onchocerca flexuosa]
MSYVKGMNLFEKAAHGPHGIQEILLASETPERGHDPVLEFVATKAKCQCDGSLVEQIACFCPRMELIRSNQSDDATTKFTKSSSPAITSRSIAVPEERVTAYRSNFSTPSCSWSQWGIWSVCSKSCGVGKTVRKRFCPCRSCSFGESTEVQSCELMSCSN